MDNLYLMLLDENIIQEMELMEIQEFEISENIDIENSEND